MLKNCVHSIEISVEADDHDINIFDIRHSDNRITITRAEGKYLLKKLKEIL